MLRSRNLGQNTCNYGVAVDIFDIGKVGGCFFYLLSSKTLIYEHFVAYKRDKL